ncbi:unnamed protein product [Citrullus colocynthis]|uniref:Uncharacterized protein n=1 Tax=Citrullus colocynthis TaxID=252529 RepID=A0ABP0XW08_9ROSI
MIKFIRLYCPKNNSISSNSPINFFHFWCPFEQFSVSTTHSQWKSTKGHPRPECVAVQAQKLGFLLTLFRRALLSKTGADFERLGLDNFQIVADIALLLDWTATMEYWTRRS